MLTVNLMTKDTKTLDELRDLARNPLTPVAVLQQLAQHPTPSVKFSVARNPGAPACLLGQLLKDPASEKFPAMVTFLAANPGIGADLFEVLSTHEDNTVRYQLALNEAIPGNILERFLYDEDTLVKWAAAENKYFPNQRVQTFAHSDDSALRLGAISNPNIDFETLYSLTQDDNKPVKLAAITAMENANVNFFHMGLIETGRADLTEVPRRWALQALGVTL